jgi:hypothetical protein
MTDITKYRNISVTHKVYSVLESISKIAGKQIGVDKLSISKTVETLATKEKKRLNGKANNKNNKKE